MIEITNTAKEQLELILFNDFTIKDKKLRISITGKECDVFVYSIGFDHQNNKDKVICHELISLILDPFAEFYLKNFTIDYIINYETDEEGFRVINHDQQKFHGKFWKKKPNLAPSMDNFSSNP